MELFNTTFSLTNVGITFGLPETTVEHELASVLTDRSVANEVEMWLQRWPFRQLTVLQTREQLNPDEHVIFIYDSAPAHRSADNPGENIELKLLSPYSSFLNIVERAISSLKAAIKPIFVALKCRLRYVTKLRQDVKELL